MARAKRKAPKTRVAKRRTARAKRKAPKTRLTKRRTARATKKTSNLAHPCSEDCSLFSEPNFGNILDDELPILPYAPSTFQRCSPLLQRRRSSGTAPLYMHKLFLTRRHIPPQRPTRAPPRRTPRQKRSKIFPTLQRMHKGNP